MTVKILLAFAVLGVAAVHSQTLPNGTVVKFCDREAVSKWDACNSNLLGKRKSVSLCYLYNVPPTKRYVYRYDFYTCSKQQVGSSVYYLITPGNCTGTMVPVVASDGKYTVFNRFDPVTKTCRLTPPEVPEEEGDGDEGGEGGEGGGEGLGGQ